MRALLSYFSITLRRNDLTNISTIEVWNDRGVCYHMDRAYKYSFQHCDNPPFPIQMKLSEKTKTFPQFFFHLWNLHQILNIFKKQKILIAHVFQKLETAKDLVRPLTKKARLITSIDSQQVKGSIILVKSSWQHFYHIFPSLRGKMILETFPLLKFQMIAVFVNTWTAAYKYPFQDCDNLPFPIQMKLS